MVGGLIQQQDVGVLQNQPGQVDSGLLSAGELVKGLRPHGGGDLQAVAHLAQPDGGAVAPRRLNGLGQGVVPAQHCLVLRSGGHSAGELLQLLLQGVEPGKGGIQHILHRVFQGIDGDLGDEAQLFPRGDDHLALVIVVFSGEDFKQGGLSAAVFAQDAHPLPGVHLKGEAVQQIVPDLKGFDQVLYGDIDHSILSLPEGCSGLVTRSQSAA